MNEQLTPWFDGFLGLSSLRRLIDNSMRMVVSTNNSTTATTTIIIIIIIIIILRTSAQCNE